MTGHQRWGWKKTIISLLAGGILLGVAQPATAYGDELEKYFSLPDIACSELYNPPGGRLTYQDAGFRWTHCAYDTPDGVVVYFWFMPRSQPHMNQQGSWFSRGDFPDQDWTILYTEATIASSSGATTTVESFGNYYEQLSDGVATGDFRDTGSPRWGVNRSDRLWYAGPPEAITQMKRVLTERAGLLLEMALIEEDPARNQQNWDLSAPDCSDFWDGEGLEPGLEVATFARYQYAVSCVIVAEGQNPFSVTESGWIEPFHLAEFGYTAFDCVAGIEGTVDFPHLGEFRPEYYAYQTEESFGAFYTNADGQIQIVAGERPDLQGIFIDADNCLAYIGWPEAIARMVAVNAGEALPHQRGVDDAPGEAEVVVADSNTPVVFSTFVPPPPTSARSLTSAAVAIVAVVILLVLRRFRPRTANTDPVSSTPPRGHTSPSQPDGDGREDRSGARRGHRIAVIGVLGLGITVMASAFEPAVRSSVTASIVNTGLVGEVLVRWGVPVAMMALFATVAVMSLTGAGRLVQPVHGVVSAVAVVVGAVATGWLWLAIPLIPVLALMLSSGVFERVAHHTRVLLLWLGTIVSLIFYSLSLAPGAEGWLPTWSGQLVIICLGMVASSVALLSVPLPGFLGRDSYQTHPLMWAGTMVLSLWLTLTLSGGAWPLLVAVGAVFVGAVVLSTVFFTGAKAFAEQQ